MTKGLGGYDVRSPLFLPSAQGSLPQTFYLSSLKALTFKVVHPFAEDGKNTTFFLNKEDKRSTSDYVISESQ